MAILGGSGEVMGPIIGALTITLISESLISRYPFHYTIILGLITIGIVIAAPRGLIGLVQDIMARTSGKITPPKA
jgi:branched-chain amino acid transport system permease protein